MTDVLERPRVASPAARTVTPTRRATGGGRRPEGSSRRADIEGLRAVAVLGVLAFHAGLPFIPGGYVGVDVFFVISGFLITGLVAAEVELTGHLSLSRFYARRIKRLLPAAVLVLVVTAVASALILPAASRQAAGGDIASAALYVSNWHFAFEQTDYLSAQTSPSPVLHYWSLSVEEQYYILWPLVLLGTVLLARRYHLVRRRVVQLAVVLVGLVSLVWSLLWTTSNPTFAFFGLMPRAWELALGGIVALAAGALSRMGPRVRAVLGWGGLAAIGWSMLVFTEATPFPGTAALVPVLGAGAVIVSGLPRRDCDGQVEVRSDLGPVALLGTRPMRSVGRVSYSLYLWHWPPLVLIPLALGLTLNPVLGVAIVLLACIPAWLSYRYVEEPFRHSTALVRFPRRAGVVAAVLTSVAVLLAFGVYATTPDTKIDVAVRQGPAHAAHSEAAAPVVETVELDPDKARDDLPSIYSDGCQAELTTTQPARCVFGHVASKQRLALLGDSHAAQWFPALERIATNNGFALEVDSKASCTAADLPDSGFAQDCATFRNAVFSAWEADASTRPDVVAVASRNLWAMAKSGQGGTIATLSQQRDGLVRTIDRLQAMGIQVVMIRDSLAPRYDVPDCLIKHADDPMACAYAEADKTPPLGADVAAAQATGVPVIDLTGDQCPAGTCPPYIGADIVYRDSHHLTASYVVTLTKALKKQLADTTAWATLTSS